MKKIIATVGVFLGAFALSVFAGTWTPSAETPPEGNVDAPINVGTADQFKTGGLAVSKLAISKNAMPSTGYVLEVNGLGLFSGLAVTGGGTFLGNVGIGTSAPAKRLEVVGGPIKATGGLIIETVSSDPVNPETGRMWLVTP